MAGGLRRSSGQLSTHPGLCSDLSLPGPSSPPSPQSMPGLCLGPCKPQRSLQTRLRVAFGLSLGSGVLLVPSAAQSPPHAPPLQRPGRFSQPARMLLWPRSTTKAGPQKEPAPPAHQEPRVRGAPPGVSLGSTISRKHLRLLSLQTKPLQLVPVPGICCSLCSGAPSSRPGECVWLPLL